MPWQPLYFNFKFWFMSSIDNRLYLYRHYFTLILILLFTNLSPVKTSKGNIKRKDFAFDMNTYGNKERTVCFSPKKHLLTNKIEETGKACELKWFRRSGTNEIFITDYKSLKEVQPRFLKSDMQADHRVTFLTKRVKMISLT